MSEDNEQKKRALEIYKILNDRMNNEINELYTIHKVFLIIAGALVALTGAMFGDSRLHIVTGLAGISIACLWYISSRAQEKWKDWWTKKTATVEDEIPSVGVWRCIADTINKKETSAKPKGQSKNNIECQPPSVTSTSFPMRVMAVIFGLASLASFAFGLHLVFCA